MIDLRKGDCLQLMQGIPDGSIDMILADLPFGTTRCSWDVIIDLDLMWIQYNRIIKPNGAILLFAQTPFDKVLGCSNLKMLRYEWIWEKSHATGHLNSAKMPMKAHENILVFYKHLPIYNPVMTHGHERKVSSAKNKSICIERRNDTGNIYNNEYPDKIQDYDSTDRFPRSVLRFPSDKQKMTLHKTQKPVALCSYFIETYTNKGDTVLDNTMGSGTTMISCQETGRNGIGMEDEPKTFSIAQKRVADNAIRLAKPVYVQTRLSF